MKKQILLFVLLSHEISAIVLIPITQTIEKNKNKNITFSVSNGTADPVAVEFMIQSVTLDKHRKEIRKKTNNVSYYPEQFILNPKETKKVRVKYTKKLPKKEEIYRVIVKELNIDVKDKHVAIKNKLNAQITMRYSYEGLLFVHSSDAIPKLTITKIKHKGKSLIFFIENKGNASGLPTAEYYNYYVKLNNQKEYLLKKNDLLGTNAHRVLAGSKDSYHLSNITSVSVNKIKSMRIEAR